jgi:hypothetical protein
MTLGQCFCSVTGLSAVFGVTYFMSYFDMIRICFIFYLFSEEKSNASPAEPFVHIACRSA